MARAHPLRARLARPMIIEIDDATAYWLEDPTGDRVSPESPSSADPLGAVLAAFDAGESPGGLALVCRLATGERHEVGSRDSLVDAALGAAGRPAVRRRASRQTATA